MTMSTSPQSQDPPSRSLNNQEVLDEDEYTAALSRIIARDFFPSLVHLDATNNYLDAVSSQNPDLIHASVRRLKELSTPTMSARMPYQTPSETPYGYGAGPSETPLRTPRSGSADERAAKRPRYETDMSLDAFQARYTSEDNSSFTQILEEENRTRRERWAWAWDAQKRVEGQQRKMVEGRERMMIEGAKEAGVRERVLIEPPEPPKGLIEAASVEDKTEEEEESIEENEKRKQLVLRGDEEDAGKRVDVMAPKKDTRPAGVDGWKFKVIGTVILSPNAVG
jgi:protein DGCR14